MKPNTIIKYNIPTAAWSALILFSRPLGGRDAVSQPGHSLPRHFDHVFWKPLHEAIVKNVITYGGTIGQHATFEQVASVD